MRSLDDGAAKALERIEASNVMDWPAEERSNWVRLIVGFFFRNPANVALIKEHIANVFDVAVEALEREVLLGPGSQSPPRSLRNADELKACVGAPSRMIGSVPDRSDLDSANETATGVGKHRENE